MNKIKFYLKEQGRTQTWLAEKLGLSLVTITNYCSNKNQPKVETLYEIAKILGIQVTDLLEPIKNNDD